MKKIVYGLAAVCAVGICLFAVYFNRNIPLAPNAPATVAKTSAPPPAPATPSEEPIGVMGPDGMVRVVYKGATPVMKKP